MKQGNALALVALYNRYAVKVFRIAKRLTDDHEVIQEIIQDVFTRVWTTSAFDSNLGQFDHWIAVVTKRIAIDHLRRQRKQEYPQEEFEVVDEKPDRILSNRMLRTDLLKAMNQLDYDQRIVLQLAYFTGHTLAEISSKLDIPLGTVKTKLHKGLKKMRMVLTDWDGEVQR